MRPPETSKERCRSAQRAACRNAPWPSECASTSRRGDEPMWIAYQNNSGSGVWMVVGYYSPNCDGQDWAKKGWWRINPGSSITAIWTTNSNSIFYAEADDGRI